MTHLPEWTPSEKGLLNGERINEKFVRPQHPVSTSNFSIYHTRPVGAYLEPLDESMSGSEGSLGGLGAMLSNARVTAMETVVGFADPTPLLPSLFSHKRSPPYDPSKNTTQASLQAHTDGVHLHGDDMEQSLAETCRFELVDDVTMSGLEGEEISEQMGESWKSDHGGDLVCMTQDERLAILGG